MFDTYVFGKYAFRIYMFMFVSRTYFFRASILVDEIQVKVVDELLAKLVWGLLF